MAKRKGHDSCTVVRRVLVTHGTMRFNHGEDTYRKTGKEWQTKACGIPLFGDDERQRGTCKGCHKGWEHPHNYPADRPQPDVERYVSECERDGWSENPEAHAAFKRHFG